MSMGTDTTQTIGDLLPEDFAETLLDHADGYQSNLKLEWPDDTPTAQDEVQELIDRWSPKTAEKRGLFTGQLKDMMETIAEDTDAVHRYIETELEDS